MKTAICFNRNEHGRKWHLNRHTLRCRLNRVCDTAAGVAATIEEDDDDGGTFADERAKSTVDGKGGQGRLHSMA